MLETLKYKAFLSYSHANSSWAKWLQRRLEGQPVARELVGRKTAMGIVPQALRPIFRDRDEFSAGAGLKDQTITALDNSAALLVMCSPAAARSAYVNEEIRLFRWRHPERPVIPVIVDGVPGGGDDECMPPALAHELDPDGTVSDRRVAAIAADVREEADGRDLALAKVVARLIGVATDEVVRRAERERRRRLWNWVAGLALISVALSGLAVWAEINRREANRQKEQAEKRLDLALASASAITDKAVSFQSRFGVPQSVLVELLGEAERTLENLKDQGTDTEELALRRSQMLRAFATSHQKLGPWFISARWATS